MSYRFLIPIVALFCLSIALLFFNPGPQDSAIQLLQSAIEKGDVSGTEVILKRHPELKEKQFEKGMTFMHLMAEQGNVPMLSALVAGGFDVEIRDKTKRTPLFVATVGGKHSAVAALINLGASVDAANMIGMTPLHVAGNRGDIKALELLLQSGANVSLAMTGGSTALHSAAYAGQFEAVKLLMDSGAAIGALDNKGASPYDYAKSANHVEIAIYLKDKMKNQGSE